VEQISVPIYKQSNKGYCSSYYTVIFLLPTTYKILSIILVSVLTPYVENYCRSSVWILTS